ncbi:MAG: aminopeptidase N [Gammaproteobacteria bacterium]
MDRTLSSPQTIYLKDYQPSSFLIKTVDLTFKLEEEKTRVLSKLELIRNKALDNKSPLVLDGEKLKLIEIKLDGAVLENDQFSIDDVSLTIKKPPDQFTLEIETEIDPANNTSLEGLYQSSGNFCTQCEAEGFRKITYYLDRPDVMAKFTTTIEADKHKYPVMLSNGNLIEQGDLDNGKHWVRWEDPFIKPCYLFALVAGDLALTKDCYTTISNRKVALEIYTEHHNADKTSHAMESLKKAMKWDEDTFGLEYDLDIYMIVAVDDFNMGAMENKGLNVFNSKYVLASPESATDGDYIGIEAVIGHEYFHNWTGNRITCRDWFQLSLKEGLTVFRDESFTADLNSPAVKRIDDVRVLRAHQFPEDAGPMAHPIRPQSYMEINNFYTVTVYNKGAEVVRMYQTLFGKEGFRKGMDLYFQRHDGQAVTTDDFRSAMFDANIDNENTKNIDLSVFQTWYDQAGTPDLFVTEHWDEVTGKYSLNFRQECAATPEQETKLPFLIPVRTELLDQKGQIMHKETVLTLTEKEQKFEFGGLTERPVPSLLRDFSAPVNLHFDYDNDQLAFLMANETDQFNRWEAGQNLAMRVLLDLVEKVKQHQTLSIDNSFINAFQKTLTSDNDPALIAEAMTLPSQGDIAQQMDVVDPEAIYQARKFVLQTLAKNLKADLENIYEKNRTTGDFKIDPVSMAKRRLQNCALHYLTTLETQESRQLAMSQFTNAANMTDNLSALRTLINHESEEKQQALSQFYDRWKDDSLVLNSWFTIQATSSQLNTLQNVEDLLEHPLFSIKNPNKVRALIGAFAQGNQRCFHKEDGSGYRFLADQIIKLDPMNPQVASRLVRVFTRWKRFDENRKALMKKELERIKQQTDLSKDVFEIVEKSLG